MAIFFLEDHDLEEKVNKDLTLGHPPLDPHNPPSFMTLRQNRSAPVSPSPMVDITVSVAGSTNRTNSTGLMFAIYMSHF